MWNDKYDIVNRSYDGDIVLFGQHYSLERAKEIMIHEEYNSPGEIRKYNRVDHVWLRFGFITNEFDEGIINGWSILGSEPKTKRGVIKATIMEYR